jgi:hypothetical protein
MRAICAIVLMLLATSAYAQELTVICKYERSVNDGKISGTSGEMSVNVLFMLPIGTPNNLKIETTKAPCYEFVGDGDDMRILQFRERPTPRHAADNGLSAVVDVFDRDFLLAFATMPLQRSKERGVGS